MVNIILYTAGALIIIGMLLSLWRFLKGPHIVDRVLAFDVMTVSSIALIALIAFFNNRIIYMDVALVYGLLSFTGVLVIARYIEKGL
ncbi:MAG TPA: monovalent cation/H+ antiporter complex subunit F [Bacteroidales bacterium]|jgi:multicomponent Na+:H+ antiporter subunit F|nr:cation:proton antiporter [Bacteroidales bacterium]HOU97863.1 monovalent cation/H+ antiporter complex subunit F [Bacteroidales bacterium]